MGEHGTCGKKRLFLFIIYAINAKAANIAPIAIETVVADVTDGPPVTVFPLASVITGAAVVCVGSTIMVGG